MTDSLRLKWPSNMGWEELVIRARLGSFERAMLMHNSRVLGEECSCVGSIRKLPRDRWLHLPWMDEKTHQRTINNIVKASLAEI